MPDPAKAWEFLEQSDLVVPSIEVDAAIHRLAAEIGRDCAASYPLLLTVMGGAVVFAGRLLPLLHFPLDLDYLHATRYGRGTQGGGIEWRVAPPQALAGRNVLLLDDILDAGHTLAGIKARLLQDGAQSVRCAVLVEKIRPDEKPVRADYVGVRIPDRFVFGCGMDARGFWRNLPEIRAMRE